MSKIKRVPSLRHQILRFSVGTVLVILVMGIFLFFQARRLTEQKTSSFVHSMLVQMGDRLNRLGEEMIYLGDTVHSNETIQKYFHASSASLRLEYGKTFLDFTSSLMNYSPTVSQIVLIKTNQSILSASTQNIVALDYLDHHYGILSEDNHSTGFFGPAFDTFSSSNLFAYVRPVFNTRKGAGFNQKLGTCVIFAKVDLLNAALSSGLSTPHSLLLLVDADDHIISMAGTYDDIHRGLPAAVLAPEQNDTQKVVHLEGRRHLVDSLEVSSLGWRLICLVPESEITIDLIPLIWWSMISCAVVFLLIAAWSVYIHQAITSPLSKLTAFIETDLDDKLQNRIRINTSTEMELYCQALNTLLDKVSDMTVTTIRNQTHMYELSLSKKRAEFSALRSQINPHFLYNTLDCLRGYGYMLNSPEVVSITNSLSAIMRYCIKGNDVVALKEEIGIINMYLDIMRIRFVNRFSIQINIDPALLNASIPRVTLQPIVENAFYHGLEATTAHGLLTITCSQNENGDCRLSVTDNGPGIAADKLQEIRNRLGDKAMQNILNIPAGHSLALVNIHNRLRSHFGEQYGLDIQCPPNGGTSVTMLIPYVPYSQVHSFAERLPPI